ncbi:MAG: aminopeptidase [Desulfarculales bacterium]|jgi:aspartyl aminopeptidase|nr:aminopeptidase [Desulfarculales bacterium]
MAKKAAEAKIRPDKSKAVWSRAKAEERKAIMALGEEYKTFLDNCKTERLAVETIVGMAVKAGFKPMSARQKGRCYQVYQNKAVMLAAPGRAPLSQGFRLIGSHIDAPRLDLKMNPLYEDQGLAFLKTHYYGGIKKYQWLAIPLAIHGVICTREGKTVEIHLGEERGDPLFTICDLLPHLSRKSQEGKKLSEAFEAERMNLLLASLPLDEKGKQETGKEPVKKAVLAYLAENYGIEEDDLISAELEIVPAGLARDVGLDRSMVGAYAQDDRICAFAQLKAVLSALNPRHWCLAWFMDKEEVGSEGPTSANTRLLELWVASLMRAHGEKGDYLEVISGLSKSKAISADVGAAFDPDYPEVHDKRNAAFMGCGVGLTKYTGHGGKYSANDANAEYVAWMRGVWDRAGVPWQAAGMGRIDEGGGGTIAKFLAAYGMEVLDAGPVLLSMHSPFEISHKADLWATAEGYKAFFQA